MNYPYDVENADSHEKAGDAGTPTSEDSDSGTVQNIREKSLSWQQVRTSHRELISIFIYYSKTAWLLLLEYIVLAILSFPSTFAVLGMAGGVIGTLLIGVVTLYTSQYAEFYRLLESS